MKAVIQSEYGTPDVFHIEEVPVPELPDTGVLVRVMAVGINKGDWHLLTGKPYLMRMAGFGLFRPVQPIPGVALSGRIEKVGAKVTRFQVGQEVIGEVRRGALAEYAVVDENHLGPKPQGFSFEEAATLPVSATTALQGLRDVGALKSGQSVLINGAAGGVGCYAVQVARALGTQVTAVCSGANVSFVQGLGAHHVVDYQRQDFTTLGTQYDVVFELVGNQPVSAIRRVVKKGGVIVGAAGGGENEWLGPFPVVLKAMIGNLFSENRFAMLMAMPNNADLAEVSRMADAGQLRPMIERKYTMSQVGEALRLQGQGHCRGKSVVLI